MSNSNSDKEISLLATGDCGPVHGPEDGIPIERYSELVRPTFAAADIRFGNCERQYSLREAAPGADVHGCASPHMAKIFTDCGFDALTIANNHMYDHGPEALLDTRALLQGKGIQVTGAGKNIDEACQPAIVERGGIRVGFLGYCSFIPKGGTAGPDKVGIAPLRYHTQHEQTDYHPKGLLTLTRVRTEPDEHDMQRIKDDIAALRRQVDIVIVAFHWGVIWIPRVIADYQVAVAHACIDAGADMIVGHHTHVPKGIEVYKGKAIFYSLGLFCMTKRPLDPHGSWKEPAWVHGSLRNYTDLDPDYPLMPYGKDATKSLIAKAVLTKGGIKRVSFLPMMIDKQYRPEILPNGDPRFDTIVNYMNWASDGFNHAFRVEGDEVVITGSSG